MTKLDEAYEALMMYKRTGDIGFVTNACIAIDEARCAETETANQQPRHEPTTDEVEGC